jgi:hypothetical protein
MGLIMLLIVILAVIGWFWPSLGFVLLAVIAFCVLFVSEVMR